MKLIKNKLFLILRIIIQFKVLNYMEIKNYSSIDLLIFNLRIYSKII